MTGHDPVQATRRKNSTVFYDRCTKVADITEKLRPKLFEAIAVARKLGAPLVVYRLSDLGYEFRILKKAIDLLIRRNVPLISVHEMIDTRKMDILTVKHMVLMARDFMNMRDLHLEIYNGQEVQPSARDPEDVAGEIHEILVQAEYRRCGWAVAEVMSELGIWRNNGKKHEPASIATTVQKHTDVTIPASRPRRKFKKVTPTLSLKARRLSRSLSARYSEAKIKQALDTLHQGSV